MKTINELKKLGKITNQRYLRVRREIGKAFREVEMDKELARNYGIYID